MTDINAIVFELLYTFNDKYSWLAKYVHVEIYFIGSQDHVAKSVFLQNIIKEN